MKINFWLLKSEPSTWSWNDQLKSKIDMWDGVRNFQARNNLMKMKKGDKCFFYHSVTEKSIVGIAEVYKEFYPDPTDTTGKFVAIDVKSLQTLKYPVTLEKIKQIKKLKNIPLLKQSRLSVMPVSYLEYQEIIKLSKKNG